jgi:glycosyltransferase involved in cell wall biosynthesis
MLLSKGHKVRVYGVGYTDIEHKNFEFIPVVSMSDVVKEWGIGDNRFELGYDHSKIGFQHDLNKNPTITTKKFRENAINEINKRKKDDDFLLLSQGCYHKPIADAVNLYLTCEPGIGYRGSYARFRAFESNFLQAFTYGSEHPRQSINGNFYDRVIPNYFDPEDFEFGEKGEYLFFIGRLIHRKGITIASKVAEHLKKKLYVAGQGQLKDVGITSKYVEHIGTLGVKERKKWLSKASVSFVPTTYLEPFGGVAVEAMLSGTPVISTNFGVFPETVKNGLSGYRCDTMQDFVDNTKKAMKLDRKKVREWAEQYLMENVNELFEKWWRELHDLYLSTKDSNKKAFNKIEKLDAKKSD